MAKKTRTKDATDVLRDAINLARKKDVRMTPYRVAKLAGINVNTLYRYLHGERDLRFANAARLMMAMGLEITKKNS